MAHQPEDSSSNATLKADYAAPNEAKSFAYPLPPATNESTEQKTAYLSALRESVTKLQEDINAFLTQKMEEDKGLASTDGAKVDDKKEEENYGEETLDDDG